MKLSDLGEFGLIERIRQAVAPTPGVVVGIGDDCAVLDLPPGERLLTSTDLLLEEVHFRRCWTDPYQLGRKSVSVNVSDIAAMGGIPRHLYLGLAVPADFTVADLDAFIAGFLAACSDYGTVLVGGDTCRSPGPLLISVTVEGTVADRELIRRYGACPGDGVYVSGTLGDSALALRQLQSGVTPPAELARRHHDPRARVELGRALAAARIPSAMIDISDGLLADLGHILEASAVGAELEEATLPLSAVLKAEVAKDPDRIELALAGGEDYELLFTVPPQQQAGLVELAGAVGVPLTRIGVVTSAATGLMVHPGAGRCGRPVTAGFDHFR
ncbi:MAG: thiamine-phosphate kinase [Desulfuromonadaceae bacterium]